MNIRNWLFDQGYYKQEKFPVKIISVGNITVGGTGKTPHVEYLIRNFLNESYKVGVLSRGYGRKTRGVIIADEQATAEIIGDEPFQYYSKFKNAIVVCVAEKRVEGTAQLLQKHNLDVIILDDAYQHRYIQRDYNILLSDYPRLFYKDFVVPSGRLRESRNTAKRADAVVITKCNDSMKSLKNEIILQTHKYTITDEVPVLFSSFRYDIAYDLMSNKKVEKIQSLALLTSIANPKPLIEYLNGKNVKILHHFIYSDHYAYQTNDINKIITTAQQNSCDYIMITEKDASKLRPFKEAFIKNNLKIIVQPIQAVFDQQGLYTEIKKKLNL